MKSPYTTVEIAHSHSRCFSGLAIIFALSVALCGVASLTSCASTEKGLAREQAIYQGATNAVAVLQPVAAAAPSPLNTIMGTVFAGVSGLLALWATHLHRSVAELKKGAAPVEPETKV